MKITFYKQYPSFKDAIADLETKGTLKYFGREGRQAEKYVYSLILHDGRNYGLFIYDSGKVEYWE